jgi:hypothetical protein
MLTTIRKLRNRREPNASSHFLNTDARLWQTASLVLAQFQIVSHEHRGFSPVEGMASTKSETV